MATMNIYLPDALKAEMEGLNDVDWFEVAQREFKRVLKSKVASKSDLTLDEGLARLRASRSRRYMLAPFKSSTVH